MKWHNGDADGDGIVDVSDLDILATNYGYGTAVIATVPEPGSITLLLCGLVCLSLRRKHR
ncbi:MAG: PEP-CTERM sorting domain-containing protein [Pirellulales bacterium]|nr:PEP-CTERM sorting domain-containing protein [Pirellulales bacterium]